MADLIPDDEGNNFKGVLDDDTTELFVQEDLDIGDEDGDDELEAKINEEHGKFKEAQVEYQEKVRAARPWSAPPLGSPRPEKQRKHEQQAATALETLSETSSSMLSDRSEYVPPERPSVERAAAKGGSQLSYMAPPRPMSADTARSAHRLSHASSIKSALLQDIPEGAILVDDKPATAAAAVVAADAADPVAVPSASLTSPFQLAASLPAADDDQASASTLQAEEDEDDGIYSDDDEDSEEEEPVDLSKLESLLSQTLDSQRRASQSVPDSTAGGVWVVQGGADSDPDDSMDSGAGAEPSAKSEGLSVKGQLQPRLDLPADKDEGQLQKDQDEEWKKNASPAQPARASAAASAAPLPQAIAPAAVEPLAIRTGSRPGALAESALGEPAAPLLPTTAPASSRASARPVTAPACQPAILPASVDDSDSHGQQEHPGLPDLLSSHAFALQLFNHDLRTLPAYQAAAASAGWSSRGAGGKELAHFGYLGFNSSRPASAPAKRRPPSAAPAAPACGANTAAARRSNGRMPRTAESQQQQQQPVARRSSTADSIGADTMLQVSRALRSSPSTRDRMAAPPPRPVDRPLVTDRVLFRQQVGDPAGGGVFRRQRPASAYTSGFGRSTLVAPPLHPGQRPMSAQAAYGHGHSYDGTNSWIGACRPVSPTGGMALASNRTAEVDVSGQTVSVYVADTTKRIAEANRCMAALGFGRRYQLKDAHSAMQVQLVVLGDSYPASDSLEDWCSAPAPTVVKTLTLRQFLTALARLKAQAVASARQQQMDTLLNRPLPAKYNVMELHPDVERASPPDVLLAADRGNDVQGQLAAAAERCEELAEHVRMLRYADLAVQ